LGSITSRDTKASASEMVQADDDDDDVGGITNKKKRKRRKVIADDEEDEKEEAEEEMQRKKKQARQAKAERRAAKKKADKASLGTEGERGGMVSVAENLAAAERFKPRAPRSALFWFIVREKQELAKFLRTTAARISQPRVFIVDPKRKTWAGMLEKTVLRDNPRRDSSKPFLLVRDMDDGQAGVVIAELQLEACETAEDATLEDLCVSFEFKSTVDELQLVDAGSSLMVHLCEDRERMIVSPFSQVSRHTMEKVIVRLLRSEVEQLDFNGEPWTDMDHKWTVEWEYTHLKKVLDVHAKLKGSENFVFFFWEHMDQDLDFCGVHVGHNSGGTIRLTAAARGRPFLVKDSAAFECDDFGRLKLKFAVAFNLARLSSLKDLEGISHIRMRLDNEVPLMSTMVPGREGSPLFVVHGTAPIITEDGELQTLADEVLRTFN